MTELLERALEKAKALPEAEQNSLAALILEQIEEIEDEARWDAAFAGSADVLAKLAAEAMAEDRAGLTEPLDPDNL